MSMHAIEKGQRRKKYLELRIKYPEGLKKKPTHHDFIAIYYTGYPIEG